MPSTAHARAGRAGRRLDADDGRRVRAARAAVGRRRPVLQGAVAHAVGRGADLAGAGADADPAARARGASRAGDGRAHEHRRARSRRWLRPHAARDARGGPIAGARWSRSCCRGRRAGLYFRVGSGFLPRADEGGFVIDYLTPAGIGARGDRSAAAEGRSGPAEDAGGRGHSRGAPAPSSACSRRSRTAATSSCG